MLKPMKENCLTEKHILAKQMGYKNVITHFSAVPRLFCHLNILMHGKWLVS